MKQMILFAGGLEAFPGNINLLEALGMYFG